MSVDLSVPAITVVCCLLGRIVKASPIADRWIPCIVGAAGGILGLAGLWLMPAFPVADPLSALAVGIVSGLASTGAHQLKKQLERGTRDAAD